MVIKSQEINIPHSPSKCFYFCHEESSLSIIEKPWKSYFLWFLIIFTSVRIRELVRYKRGKYYLGQRCQRFLNLKPKRLITSIRTFSRTSIDFLWHKPTEIDHLNADNVLEATTRKAQERQKEILENNYKRDDGLLLIVQGAKSDIAFRYEIFYC